MGLTWVLLLVLLAACVQQEVVKVDLTGKKVLMLIAPSNFRDEEFSEPYNMLTSNGAKVTVASVGTAPAEGMLGMTVTPDIDVSSAKAADYDAVIFVGGSGVDEHGLFNNGEFLRIAKEANESGKAIGAICLAPKILASAGLLQGKKATVYSAGVAYIKSKGAEHVGQDLVQDGKIITASGPQAATKFGNAIAQALTK